MLVADEDGVAVVPIECPDGVALLSQSCDVVRGVEQRPFVQVAALVRATSDEIDRAAKGSVPSRLYLQCLESAGLLIDLDATATVHKEVAATWPRSPGCQTDAERRIFAAALARYRQRFAFPDAFNQLILPVRRWVESKRSKASPQGEFVRAMHEVRVSCDNWEAPEELSFLIIVDHRPDSSVLEQWEACARTLEEKAAHEDYPAAEFRIATYDDISAREYLESDRLDWDGLSDAH